MASTSMLVALKLRWRARVCLQLARGLAWALSRVLGMAGVHARANIAWDEDKCDVHKLYQASITCPVETTKRDEGNAGLTALCECGHWRIFHTWWGGCLAFFGRGVCTCPCFRKRK